MLKEFWSINIATIRFFGNQQNLTKKVLVVFIFVFAIGINHVLCFGNHRNFIQSNPQLLEKILDSYKSHYDIAEKISCDFNQDNLQDYVIVLVDKMEKEIKLVEDAGYYEEVYPLGYDSSKTLKRHFLILEGQGNNLFVVRWSSDQTIPSRDFSQELNYADVIVPSYLPPKVEKDTLTLVIQKRLSTGRVGSEHHQMNLRFVYDKKIKNWYLYDCLSKYKGSVRSLGDQFDGTCLLTNKYFGRITLDSFNVYEMFDTEKLGCDGWQQIISIPDTFIVNLPLEYHGKKYIVHLTCERSLNNTVIVTKINSDLMLPENFYTILENNFSLRNFYFPDNYDLAYKVYADNRIQSGK